MKSRSIIVTALVFGAVSSVVWADDCPLADLKAKAKGTTALGNWEVATFNGRKDLPYLTDKKMLEAPGGGGVNIDAANVNIRSSGLQNNESLDTMLAAVVFTVKVAGNYAVGGRLKDLWCDNDKSSKNTIQWAVLRGNADGKKFKSITGGETGDGDSVDLAEIEKLKSIPMAAGEKLVITLFKPGYWGASGGNLNALTIDKVAATPESVKAEEKK